MTWFIAFNAVLRKEVLVYLRRKQPLFAALLMASALSATILASWPARSTNWIVAAGLSNGVLLKSQFALLCSALALTPAIAAGMISGERERNTWDMCAASPMPRTALAAGKWAASTGVLATLVLAMAPILLTVLFLVGVDVMQVLACLAIVLGAAAVTALAGIAASASTGHTVAATVLGYVFAVFLLGAFPLVLFIAVKLRIIPLIPGSPLEPYAMGTSPLLALVSVLQDGARWQTLLTNAVHILGLIAILWWVTLARLARPIRPQTSLDIHVHASFWTLDASQRHRPIWPQPPIPDGANPILLREYRWGLPQGPKANRAIATRVFAIAFGCAFLMLVTLSPGISNHHEIVAITAGVLTLGAVLYLPVVVAGIFPHERDRRTADSLCLTSQSPPQIAWGKCAVALRRTTAVFAPVLLVVTGVWLLVINAWTATIVYAIVIVCVSAIAWVGYTICMLASMRSQTASGAIVRSLAYLGVTATAGPLLVYTLAEVARRAGAEIAVRDLDLIASIFSPAMLFLWAMDRAPENVLPWTATIALMQSSVAALGLAMAVHRFKYRFDRIANG